MSIKNLIAVLITSLSILFNILILYKIIESFIIFDIFPAIVYALFFAMQGFIALFIGWTAYTIARDNYRKTNPIN